MQGLAARVRSRGLGLGSRDAMRNLTGGSPFCCLACKPEIIKPEPRWEVFAESSCRIDPLTAEQCANEARRTRSNTGFGVDFLVSSSSKCYMSIILLISVYRASIGNDGFPKP